MDRTLRQINAEPGEKELGTQLDNQPMNPMKMMQHNVTLKRLRILYSKRVYRERSRECGTRHQSLF